MKNFALIGAAGYIAPRHMKAIKENGHNLVAALDKSDSVGIIDSYFPESDFFIETERFDRHLDKLRRQGNNKVDYVSICSPNYLHDAHIRLSLRNDADAICEKPIVLNPWNVDALQEIEKETGRHIYTILQLRLHPSIIALKEKIQKEPADKIHSIDLTYITGRGQWYFYSWKGNIEKSGGIATNIGIHFFDMLIWIFGNVKENEVHLSDNDKAAGFLRLEKASVRWFLSVDINDLPDTTNKKGQRTFRSIRMDDQEIEFSEGFTDLHTDSYRNILSGQGFRLEEARASIQTVYQIRHAMVIKNTKNSHPLCRSSK